MELKQCPNCGSRGWSGNEIENGRCPMCEDEDLIFMKKLRTRYKRVKIKSAKKRKR